MVPTDGPYHGVWRELEFVAHRDEQNLKLWFEVDRTRTGASGMLASLLGSGKLKRELSIPVNTKLDEVGSLILNYLEHTTAAHES